KAFSSGQGLPDKVFSWMGGDTMWLDSERLGGDRGILLGRLCPAVLERSTRLQHHCLALPGTRVQTVSGEAKREACLCALAFGAAR
ncbi:DUF58 domain-containing protein, partial [Pseudomonas aeruginosa]